MKVVNENTLELEERDDNVITSTSDIYAATLNTIMEVDSEEFSKLYKKYKKAEEDFKKAYEPFKERLLEVYKIMPDMPTNIIIGGVKLTYVSPSTRSTIDSKKLKEEEPEIAKKFTKTTDVSATIRIDKI